ncbi:hypothetical protein LTR64_004707 [Lithohypha guttulata]|uniref:uncharacterized protein n=1 Tax=Lithohypha guttulata TaxID=1690604 RepID=UPI002DE06D6E|nr:hypothetical protein LTR51_005995 [Lithohypha guttulata]
MADAEMKSLQNTGVAVSTKQHFSAEPPPVTPCFMGLPSEIRTMILMYLLHGEDELKCVPSNLRTRLKEIEEDILSDYSDYDDDTSETSETPEHEDIPIPTELEPGQQNLDTWLVAGHRTYHNEHKQHPRAEPLPPFRRHALCPSFLSPIRKHGLHPQILATCRQLRQEGQWILYWEKTVRVTWYMAPQAKSCMYVMGHESIRAAMDRIPMTMMPARWFIDVYFDTNTLLDFGASYEWIFDGWMESWINRLDEAVLDLSRLGCLDHLHVQSRFLEEDPCSLHEIDVCNRVACSAYRLLRAKTCDVLLEYDRAALGLEIAEIVVSKTRVLHPYSVHKKLSNLFDDVIYASNGPLACENRSIAQYNIWPEFSLIEMDNLPSRKEFMVDVHFSLAFWYLDEVCKGGLQVLTALREHITKADTDLDERSVWITDQSRYETAPDESQPSKPQHLLSQPLRRSFYSESLTKQEIQRRREWIPEAKELLEDFTTRAVHVEKQLNELEDQLL